MRLQGSLIRRSVLRVDPDRQDEAPGLGHVRGGQARLYLTVSSMRARATVSGWELLALGRRRLRAEARGSQMHRIKLYEGRIMKKTIVAASGAVLLMAGQVQAQSASEAVSAEAYLAALQQLAQAAEGTAAQKPVVGRGATFGVPGAFSLPQGSMFFSGSVSDKRPSPGMSSGDSTDASAAFGIGFGDAQNSIGFDLVVGIDSVDPKDFADSGTISLKFSRQLPSFIAGQTAAVAFGIGTVESWGDSKDAKANHYLAYTSTFGLDLGDRIMPGLFSIGYGTHLGANDPGKNAFVSAGVGLTDWLSAGAGIAGDEYHVGVNLHRPFGKYDGTLSLSYTDSMKSGPVGGRWNLSLAVFAPNLF